MVFFTQDVPPSVLTALNHANDSDVVPADLTAATLDDMDTGVGFLDSLSPYTALRDLHTPLTTYSIPALEASRVMSADTDIDPCPSTLDIDTPAPGTASSMVSAISDDNVPSDLPITGEYESGVTPRSEEHTSELQSRETISYAVFCLKKKKKKNLKKKKIGRLTQSLR